MTERKTLIVNKNVHDLLLLCKEEYLKHHPEMKETPISMNKIIFEISAWYLR